MQICEARGAVLFRKFTLSLEICIVYTTIEDILFFTRFYSKSNTGLTVSPLMFRLKGGLHAKTPRGLPRLATDTRITPYQYV